MAHSGNGKTCVNIRYSAWESVPRNTINVAQIRTTQAGLGF